jgi:tetratricopeptide (TPR) repeat protein
LDVLRRKKQSKLAGLLLAVMLLLAGAASYRYYVMRKAEEMGRALHGAVKGRRSVAVLGFKNLGRAEAAWLSTALAEELTTELAAGEQLRTIPGENVAQMKINLSLSDADSYAPETLTRVRGQLAADDLVSGSYLDLGKESGGQLRLDVCVQDTISRETICKVAQTGTETNLFDLVSKMGDELRHYLGCGEVTAADAGAVRASAPSDPESVRLYAEGLKRLRMFDALGARDLLEKAVRAEPDYPLAHDALAQSWLMLGYEDNARKEAKKAFDLSSNLSREERLSVEGRYRETIHDWNKAIELYSALFKFFPDNLDYGLRVANTQRMAGKGKDALVTIAVLRSLAHSGTDNPRVDMAESEAADSQGDFKVGQTAAARAVEEASTIGAPLLVAAAQLDECWALQQLGQYEQGLATCEKARVTYARVGDRDGEAGALLDIGGSLNGQGDSAGALREDEQAFALSREVGDRSRMASAVNNTAVVLSAEGNHLAAEQHYEQALAIYKEVGSKGGAAKVLGNMAAELEFIGNLGAANAKFRQALSLNREIGNHGSEAWALKGLGATLYLQGELRESGNDLDLSLEICRKASLKRTCGFALSNQGNLLMWEGKLDQAKVKQQEALAIWNDVNNQGDAAESNVAIAKLSIEQGQAVEAEALVRDARDIFRKKKWAGDEIWADSVLAMALLAEGKPGEAAKEIDSVTAEKLQNEEVRLEFALATAFVRAASGKPADQSAAIKVLGATLGEATKHGFVGYQLEARLALGEIEMQSGRPGASAHLGQLQRDASAKGFELVARKAASANKVKVVGIP